MAYADIRPGRYVARAKGGQFTKSKDKGTPCAAILCEFDIAEGKTEQLWWTGWLSPAAIENTCKTLATIGYDDKKGMLPDGSIPENFFEPGKEFEITVEEEPYINKNGEEKKAIKIKWINPLGGGQFGALEPQEVKNLMAGIDIRKEMMVARQKLGLKTSAPAPAVKNHAPQTRQEAQERASMPEPAPDMGPDLNEPLF